MLQNSDARKASQGYVKLDKMTVRELRDLLERQVKILQNRSFVSKLPDKGQKILAYRAQIENEIKKHEKNEDLSNVMSKINLNEEIEWTGHVPNEEKILDNDIDSDDESDPLKLLANHSGTQKSRQKIDTTKPQSNHKLYTEDFCEKYDNIAPPVDRFKPFEPKNKDDSKTGYKRSTQHVKNMLGDHWEITAATLPVPIHGNTKNISLVESMSLQAEQIQRLKEIQFKHAFRRLNVSNEIAQPSGSANAGESITPKNRPDVSALIEGSSLVGIEESNDADDEPDSNVAVIYNIVDECS